MNKKEIENKKLQQDKQNKQQPEETKGGHQENGQPHANQHTVGRHDDRGRKE